MKTHRVGDVNGDRTHGLLRCIPEATGLGIGVLWFRTRADSQAAAWGLVPGVTCFEGAFTVSGEERASTFASAMAQLAQCPLVFLAPDTGVEVKRLPYGSRGSARYVYWREMAALFERGQSLLVQQHHARVKREPFEASLVAQFKARLAPAEVTVFSTPHEAFFLVLQERHAGLLPAIKECVHSRWEGQLSKSNGGAA